MNRPILTCCALTLFAALPVAAQPPTPTPPVATRTGNDALADADLIEFKFGEEIELKGLVDYVSRRLEINFLYDELLLDKKVTIKGPGKIPTSSLLGLLQSVLKMKDLAVVDTDVAGWKRIQEATKLPQVARPGNAAAVIKQHGEFGAASAVTQVFVLKHVDPVQVDLSIKPFLTLPAANSVALKEQGVLIVTDFAANLVRIAKLIELLDNPKPEVFTELVPLTHAQAAVLSEQISQVLAVRQHATDPVGTTVPSADSVIAVAHDERTNQLVLIGSPKQIEKMREFVRALDLPLEVTTEVYETKHILAERLDRVVQELVQPAASKRVFASAVDGTANLLFVTTTPEFHQRIRALHERMDVATAKAPSPIAYYRLQHVTARELLQTLRAMEGEAADSLPGREQVWRGLNYSSTSTRGAERSMRDRMSSDGAGAGSSSTPSRTPSSRPSTVAGVNRPPPAPGTEVPLPPAYSSRADGAGALVAGTQDDAGLRYLPGQARVTADESSNTLIIVADPEVQEVYAELIRTLDQPRPQVLIEAKLVVIDSSDEFAFGVEIAGGDRAARETGAR